MSFEIDCCSECGRLLKDRKDCKLCCDQEELKMTRTMASAIIFIISVLCLIIFHAILD